MDTNLNKLKHLTPLHAAFAPLYTIRNWPIPHSLLQAIAQMYAVHKNRKLFKFNSTWPFLCFSNKLD